MDISEKNLAKLQRLFNLMDDDALTKEQFLAAFRGVIEFIKKIEAKNDTELGAMATALAKSFASLKKDAENEVSVLKKRTLNTIEAQVASLKAHYEAKMAFVDARVDSLKDGLDSTIPGPKGDKGDPGSPDTKEQIRDKLEKLVGKERLDKSAIRGLDEEFKKLGGTNRVAIFGGGSGERVANISLTDQCNGVTKAFTLPTQVKRVIGVWGTQFPVTFDPADWTLDGRTLTLGAGVGAPETNQTLIALCSVIGAVE